MTETNQTILLVDDDTALLELLSEYLSQEGFSVDTRTSGQQALDEIHSADQYAVIVLDIMMPGPNGLEVLQLLRQRINTPVIMLTGRGDDVDRIIGLEMGADDYLGKPCNPRELLARIRSVLRRSQPQPQTTSNAPLQLHGISLDSARQSVMINSQPLELTAAEFQLLQLLMQSAGNPLSKEELTRKVLHRELTPYDRSIDVHVSRLRKKLEAGLSDGEQWIKTIRGQGYLFIGES